MKESVRKELEETRVVQAADVCGNLLKVISDAVYAQDKIYSSIEKEENVITQTKDESIIREAGNHIEKLKANSVELSDAIKSGFETLLYKL